MMKILVVDDDDDVRASLRVVLEARGYQVFDADSGQAGLKAAGRYRPDLIILDVMMETKDAGIEVARALRRDRDLKDIRILMRTAIKEKTGLSLEKAVGDPGWLPVDEYCDKTIGINELLSKIDVLLKKT